MNAYKNDGNEMALSHGGNNQSQVNIVGYAKGHDGRQIPIISFGKNQNSVQTMPTLSSEQVLRLAGSAYINKRFQKSMRHFRHVVGRTMQKGDS